MEVMQWHIFHVDYAALIHDIISCGYAEKVPSKDLAYSHSKVLYIPHHGVYHLNKRKISELHLRMLHENSMIHH